MTDSLQQLATVLRERVTIIADEESRRDEAQHMSRLQEVSERLEKLEQKLSASIDPQLRHYLQRRSYNKALEFIEAR